MKILMVASILGMTLCGSSSSSSQEHNGIDQYYLRAGPSFPSMPGRFYDYWQTGVSVGGGIGWKMSPTTTISLSVDGSRFSIDEQRFLQYFKLGSGSNSISGGATSIVMVGGNIHYFPPDEPVPLYVAGGAALAVSSIGEVEATYSDFSASQPSVMRASLLVTAGAGLEFALNPKTDWFVELRYNYAVVKSDDANSGSFPIFIGFKVWLE